MAQPEKKSNSVVTSAFDLITGIITIEVLGLANGKFTVDAATIAGKEAYGNLTDLGKRGLLHGITQRISDRAAIGRDKVTGISATPAQKFEAMKGLADHYANGGTWELAGGGLPPLNRPALYQAVAAVRGFTPEQVEQVYRDKGDDVVRTLLSISAIAGKYTELCRVNAPKNDKADALLEELMKATAPKEEPKQDAAQ